MNNAQEEAHDVYNLDTLTTRRRPIFKMETISRLEEYLGLEQDWDDYLADNPEVKAMKDAPKSFLDANPDVKKLLEGFRRGDITLVLSAVRTP